MHSPLRLAALALILAVPAAAQQPAKMPGMNMPPAMDMADVFSKAPFRPGLGDLMTALVQPRHIKLGLAGVAQNWDYAAYELDELREAFDDVGKQIVKHGKLEIAPAIASTVKTPLDALAAAVKAKDSTAFTTAYAELTAGCNACHQSAGHPMIVIKVPAESSTAFPDQEFSPRK